MRLFSPDKKARFISRPNRFLVIAESPPDGGGPPERLPCHCPNPGRLTECLFPGTELLLEKRTGGREAAKTLWTAAALRHKGNIVPLFASRANRAAEELVLPEVIPGLREIHREFSLGASRFDFLCIGRKGERHLLEVKACSLVEYGTAMFPDAPSARALKHLEELAALSGEGYACHVLFVIMHGNPSVFIPNLHTDPAFASALGRYCAGEEPAVKARAALLRCGEDGLAELAAPSVPVDLSRGALAARDAGNYLVLLELAGPRRIEIGALGTFGFKKGWYVYSGSAGKNLSARISRHLRKEGKKKHWHIDYLTPYAAGIKALPIMSCRNLECELAGELERLGGEPLKGFGSSDCRCAGHLFYFPAPPLSDRAFTDTLFRYRHIEGFRK
ncbi:MAG: DNA/RNA nuclease SfsA [Treponema sp.]|jgi:sugar fermentation stimulation protein A|nr:DNA/RNA nuclease SfsA [Treponema sp.]